MWKKYSSIMPRGTASERLAPLLNLRVEDTAVNNPSNVHAFFAKLASAASGSADKQPSLTMLHSHKPARTGYVGGSLQDVITSALNVPMFVATELNDFGVGLPPMASC